MFSGWYWHTKRGRKKKWWRSFFFARHSSCGNFFKVATALWQQSWFTSFSLCHCYANPFDTNKWYVQYCRHERDLIEWYFGHRTPWNHENGFFTIKISILRWKTRFHDPKEFYVQKYHSIRSLLCLQYWTYHLFMSKGFAQQWHSLKLVNPDAFLMPQSIRICKF